MANEFKTDALGNNSRVQVAIIQEITDDVTLGLGDSGTVYLVGTDAKTITLPATEKGVVYTFVNSGADGNNTITLSPNADDGIIGSIANASADSVASGTADKDIVNTKATANKGDRITVIGDGVDGWYIIDGVGIWASEA